LANARQDEAWVTGTRRHIGYGIVVLVAIVIAVLVAVVGRTITTRAITMEYAQLGSRSGDYAGFDVPGLHRSRFGRGDCGHGPGAAAARDSRWWVTRGDHPLPDPGLADGQRETAVSLAAEPAPTVETRSSRPPEMR
jgi:hypothetical protein